MKPPRRCKSCREIGHRSDRCPNGIVVVDLKPPPPTVPPVRIGSRESKPPRELGEKSGDPEDEPAVGGVMQPPGKRVRVRARRTAPRAATFAVIEKNANRMSVLDAFLDITPGAAIEFDLDAMRPRTRGDCVDGPRPCPFVGCRDHLYLDVNVESGSIKLNFPHLELEQLTESCALDIADRGEHTLEEVGVLTNLTRERIRQIVEPTLRTLQNNRVLVEQRP